MRYTTFEQAVRRFHEIQKKYDDAGAWDTEPRAEFERIISDLASGNDPVVPQKAYTWQLYTGHPKSYFAGREMTRAAERVVRLGQQDLDAVKSYASRNGIFFR